LPPAKPGIDSPAVCGDTLIQSADLNRSCRQRRLHSLRALYKSS
jgi:hypothetical protein